MNKEEILKELEQLKTKVEEFIEPKKVEGKWKPLLEKTYSFIDIEGDVRTFYWTGDLLDYFRLQTNNVFRTKEDAKTWLKVHDRVHELIGDWEADWNSVQGKYYLYYCNADEGIFIRRVTFTQIQGTTYMPEHAANTLLQEFTMPELLIWMGIKR